MKRIAISGLIGAGKSTLGSFLREQGFLVIDSDQVARTVVAKGSIGLRAVIDYFGRAFLQEDGELDRSALAKRVFSNPSDTEALNKIVHPLILESITATLSREHRSVSFIEIPLLSNEWVSALHIDEAWHVVASSEHRGIRLERERDMTPDDVAVRFSRQLDVEPVTNCPTIFLLNDGSREDFLTAVNEVLTTQQLLP